MLSTCSLLIRKEEWKERGTTAALSIPFLLHPRFQCNWLADARIWYAIIKGRRDVLDCSVY